MATKSPAAAKKADYDSDSSSVGSSCPTPKPAADGPPFVEVLNRFLVEAAGTDAEANDAFVASFDGLTIGKAVAAGLVDKLNASSKSKKNPVRTRVPIFFKALINENGRAAEPYIALIATSLFELLADKVKPIAAAAAEAFADVQKLALFNPETAAAIFDVIMPGLANPYKAQTKLAVLNYIVEMADVAPKQLGISLGRLIPLLTDLLHDTLATVREAAVSALTKACGVCDNNDLRPFMPLLISALGNPEQITECIFSLASLTFVQVVDASALGILVPLLSRGFKERKVAISRCTAVIITNVSKLTDDPKDGKYLLPELLPACRKAANELAEPEARGVCVKAVEQLERIEAAVKAAPPEIDVKAMIKLLKPLVPTSTGNCANTLKWISTLCTSLASCKCFDIVRWEESMVPFMKATSDADAETLTSTAKNALALVAKDLQGEAEVENDDAEVLCDCKFTLAYGTKILLHNTDLKIKRGYRYGLLGGNDCGKSTLLRAIANEQIEGLPPASQLRTVFVEADIQGEMSHLPVLDYVFTDDKIKACGIGRDDVAAAMLEVGFTQKMLGDAITTLSGGWRMKLALCRAMLQKADLLLCDEPTNHLDVINVAWLENYLCSLKDVTSIIVSHNAGLLDKCCTHMLHIQNLKLSLHKGNLSSFVEKYPIARSFFELSASKLTFKFPQPSFIEGVRSKGKALMKMEGVSFTYPGNPAPTLRDVTVQVSLASRVACVGVNGAGKSTMIKLLTGELQPCTGSVWVHPSARIAYVAQHAFHHIEQHLKKTANEYIAWRYQYGEDKEALKKVTLVLTEEEEKKIKEPCSVDVPLPDGTFKKEKRIIADLTGGRRKTKIGYEYEVKFQGMSNEQNLFIPGEKLETWGFAKIIKETDILVEAREGMYQRPLTQANIERHIADVGLAPEFATHTRMGALSGGQKVKVVLAASMWNQPHILVVDEPTNYLDRESLGALANAIKEYEGGIVMITHNEEFAHTLCPETWVLENGRLDCKGDAEWMKSALAEKVEFKLMEEMVDGAGNVIKVKAPKKTLSRKEQKAEEKRRKARKDAGMASESEED
jgi:elongation factor 3